jgi:hypothetical protein
VKFASYRNEPFGSSRVSTWYLYTPTGDLVCTSAPKDVGYKPYPHKAVWTVTYFTRLRQTNA